MCRSCLIQQEILPAGGSLMLHVQFGAPVMKKALAWCKHFIWYLVHDSMLFPKGVTVRDGGGKTNLVSVFIV